MEKDPKTDAHVSDENGVSMLDQSGELTIVSVADTFTSPSLFVSVAVQ